MEQLHQDSDEWSKYFNKKNDLTSVPIDGKQVLESSGNFEYQGNYYLLGVLYHDMNGDDNNEERGIFRGVIVDMEKYISTKTGEELLIQKTNGAVEGIMQPKN